MRDALRHRGPDDAGIETIGSVGLVHTRLAIVDPRPGGHQPMRHPSGRWWLTYNGEVFNHRALREELAFDGFKGGTDTETLLHALNEWGDGAVARCNGLFAFAALDLDSRRLLLVRDRFGVKPLYLARWDGGLWFASEIRALLAAGVPAVADADLVRHAIAFGWVNGPHTPLRGITRVTPGSIVSVDLDTVRSVECRWYAPESVVDPEVGRRLAQCQRSGLRDELEAALRTAVRRRLMADVPVGTMCSGGLDSSLVAALAAQEAPRIHAFNASVADQPENDEAPFAERVAQALGIELHTVRQTADTWRADLVTTVMHTEYPLTHESSVPMSQIAGRARDQGIKVLLSGEGADELFGGYEWTSQAPYRDFAARSGRLETAARRVYRWLQEGPVRLSGRDPRGRHARLVEEYEQRVRRRAMNAYSHHDWPRRRLEAACLADLGTYLPHLLNRQDKNTMQRSIETRVPFLDPDLVALAVNLPLEVKLEPRRKQILREVAERHIPDEVVRREKVGFGFDAGRYIVSAARPMFLLDGRLRELLEVAAERWQPIVAGLSHSSALLFWTGEVWTRGFLEGQSPSSIESELWR
jgi:asparagine synthase (glutamine-hydrolysing)